MTPCRAGRFSGRWRSRCSRRRRHAGSWTEDWNGRHGTATAASAVVRLFSIGDEERRASYRRHPHRSGTRYGNSITNFWKILRISSGTKVNSRRCEDLRGPAIFGVTLQRYVNGAAISASILGEICDLEKMLVRHGDYESRISARDDLAIERIGESNCCGSKKRKSDEISRGEHFHMSTHIDHLYFASGIVAGRCSSARDLAQWRWRKLLRGVRTLNFHLFALTWTKSVRPQLHVTPSARKNCNRCRLVAP